MLILLTDKILDQGTSNYPPDELTNCLENILKARFEGKHLVLAETSPGLLNLQLSQTSKVVLLKIFGEFSQYGRLRRQITCYIRVVEPSRTGIEIISQNQKTIVDVPIWYFEDTAAIQETILLTENLEDAKLYIHLIKAYLTTEKSGIVVKASPRGGGGSTLKTELDQQCLSRTFCLSMVDTDRYGPGDALGETAKRVQSSWQDQLGWYCKKTSHSALVKVIILKVREIENLIPTNLIRETLPKSTGQPMFDRVDALKKWDAHYPNKEWRNFIDLKKGLCGYDVLRWQKGLPAEKCWSDFSNMPQVNQCKNGKRDCTKRKECNCWLWEGLGDKVLSQVIEYFSEHDYHDIIAKNFFDFQSNESLKGLTEELLAWCCALERLRC